jgi:hypothetical protein
MALSATSLEINEITTELLFSRGTLFEPGQVYVPQYSSIGTTIYGTWNVFPISTTFSNYLYGYSNFPQLLSSVNFILTETNAISTSLQGDINLFSTFSVSTLLTYSTFQAYGPSTIAQFSVNYTLDSNTASNRYSTSLSLVTQLPNVSVNTYPPIFMSSLFNQNSNNIVNLAYFYYTPSTNTQGIQSRYIGPGISSIYSTLFATYPSSVFSTFPGILSNTSTSLSTVNSTVLGNISIAKKYVAASFSLIENFSSVSSVYGNSFSTFQSTLSSTTYAIDISSFSTYMITRLNTFSVTTLGPTVSSFASTTLLIDIPRYVTNAISSLQSVNLLVGSISSMSTTIGVSSTQIFSSLLTIQSYSGLSSLNYTFLYSMTPIFNSLTVSTGQVGYQQLTSTSISSLSSFSTLFPTYIGSNILLNLQINTANVCSLSTQIVVQASSLISLTYQFDASVGVSSVYGILQSTVNTTSTLYYYQMSTISGNFNTSFVNVNPVTGLSSLASTGSIVFSTIESRNSTINTYVNYTYLSEVQAIYYGSTGYFNTIATLGSNQSSFISTVGFINLVIDQSLTLSTVTKKNTDYTSSMMSYPNGYLYSTVYFISSLNKSTLLLLNPFIGSTSFFYQFGFPVNYSTIFSTNFFNFTTSSITGIESLKTQSLKIQQPSTTLYSLDVVGAVLIQPYEYTSSVFLVGNSNPWLYTFGISSGKATLSTGSSFLYRLANGNIAINAYGAALTDSAATLALQENTHFFYDIYGQIKSLPISSLLTSYDFLSPTGNTVFNSAVPVSFFGVNNTSVFSQLSSVINSNRLITFSGIGTSTSVGYHTFSSVTSGGANYKSMGPMTSVITNGQIYLMTAMSNVAYSYQTTWYQPASITNSTFYTMFLTNSLYPGSLAPTQFSTIIGPEPTIVTEINDAVWAGKNWVVVGDGAFVSKDNYTWTRTLPSTTERLLRYRSLDYNGKDIITAQISSIPNYVALLKSQDFGYTWTQISTIKLSVYGHSYSDSVISTGLYSVKIKWAYNSWNLFALPTMLGAISLQASQAFFQSFDGGYTWSSNSMTNTTNVDSNTMAVLYEPLQQIQPSLQLPNLNLWARDDPNRIYFGHSMAVRFSTITFNEGDLTILKNLQNSLLRGYVGINTLNPQYALDIGYGNARQATSVNWTNPSDQRVKNILSTIEYSKICNNLEHLRLVTFEWNTKYRDEHGLPAGKEFGFISQEVGKIFPSSIYFTNEFGLSSFQTLDTDQLYKMKFAVTQTLLRRISSLALRILYINNALDKL